MFTPATIWIPTAPVTLYCVQSIVPVSCVQPLSLAAVDAETAGHFLPEPVGIIAWSVYCFVPCPGGVLTQHEKFIFASFAALSKYIIIVPSDS